MDNILEWIEKWYVENCDGDWEHNNGIKIDTLENPGWSIIIDLKGTKYFKENIEKVVAENDNNVWYSYHIDSGKFMAFGSSTGRSQKQ